MTMWAVVFVIMTAAQGVGNTHRGHWIPFWQDACRDGRRNACRNLALIEATTCNNGSGWACNEFGLLLAQRRYVGAGVASALDRRSHESFRRACELGFSLGCENLRLSAVDVGSLRSGAPQLSDYRIVLREGQRPVPESAFELYQRACRQGFTSACENPAGKAR